jgi:hypothetical protein
LTELGKGVFTIKLGKLTLDSEVIIADIEDDALLGNLLVTSFLISTRQEAITTGCVSIK